MSDQFVIRVETRFEAAHNLTSYHGKPEPLHGHSWKVEAKFRCNTLDSEDMGIDYLHVQSCLRKLGQQFDHRYINEIPPFDRMSPTSENLAKWFFDELNQPAVRENTRLDEVVVWEGPETFVAYSQTNSAATS